MDDTPPSWHFISYFNTYENEILTILGIIVGIAATGLVTSLSMMSETALASRQGFGGGCGVGGDSNLGTGCGPGAKGIGGGGGSGVGVGDGQGGCGEGGSGVGQGGGGTAGDC